MMTTAKRRRELAKIARAHPRNDRYNIIISRFLRKLVFFFSVQSACACNAREYVRMHPVCFFDLAREREVSSAVATAMPASEYSACSRSMLCWSLAIRVCKVSLGVRGRPESYVRTRVHAYVRVKNKVMGEERNKRRTGE